MVGLLYGELPRSVRSRQGVLVQTLLHGGGSIGNVQYLVKVFSFRGS
jgi:hypothetical protein